MRITLADIQAQRELLERGERILEAQEQQAERARLRDTFAAAALTGFIRGIPDNSVFHLGLIAKQSYEVADAMLRERGVTEPMPKEKLAEVSVTLTDAEREAVEAGIEKLDHFWFVNETATLRGLLERTK